MTEIALVADLHGNWPATRAVDEDLRRRGIEEIWCLGDVVGKGPSSPQTFDWAMERCRFILLGNWDEGIGRKQFPKDEFYYEQLGEERMRILPTFPMEYVRWISGRKMRLFHGRPILPEPYYVHSEYEALAPYFEPDFDLVGYADVHRQGMRTLGFKGLLFNTGSVGNGLGVPMAQYVILRGDLDSRETSPLDISLITLPYDRDEAIRDALEAGKRGLVNADLYCREIRTGRYARGEGKRSAL